MLVALMARVSTEEQAKHGLSIDAQIDALRKWAQENGHTVVGEYVDAGISGKKPYTKRPALSRFMADIQGGVKVDALVFTKLDRFYRSVKLYYQAIEIMDRYKVAWIAIQEDYETVTASGRFKVNIMLSVAENEADRTSERIKAVFDRKIELGQPITRSLPLGLKIDGKRVVPDENAPAVREAFELYSLQGTKMAVYTMLREKYGISLPPLSITNMLKNPLYKGQYRNNPAYCEPIVPAQLFDQVQIDLERRYTRHPPSNRVYLFSGLLVCKECGRRYAASVTDAGKVFRYRCPHHYTMKDCKNSASVREDRLETHLLEYISSLLEGYYKEYKTVTPKAPTVNKAAIEAKIERLKELYIDGDITKEKYRIERDKLTAKLSEEQPKKQSQILSLIGSNFREDYETLAKEDKKTFWRSIVDKILVDKAGKLFIFLR